MAPRPDRPDPSHDGDERDDARGSHDDPPSDQPVSDQQWAEIVADLRGDDDPVADAAGQDDPRTSSGPAVTYPVAPWVADRRVVRPAQDRAQDRPADGDDDVLPRELGGRDWDATAQMDEAERRVDEAEHFRPADPGPVLGGDPLLTMAWFAVAGMPVLWLVVLIAWRSAPPAIMQASVVVFLLGLVLLLWRMPHRRDAEHDDDGAVV